MSRRPVSKELPGKMEEVITSYGEAVAELADNLYTEASLIAKQEAKAEGRNLTDRDIYEALARLSAKTALRMLPPEVMNSLTVFDEEQPLEV